MMRKNRPCKKQRKQERLCQGREKGRLVYTGGIGKRLVWLDSGQKAREWRLDLKSRDGMRVPVNMSTGEESAAGEDPGAQAGGEPRPNAKPAGGATSRPEPVLHQGPTPHSTADRPSSLLRGLEPQPSNRVPDLFLSGERLSPSPQLPSTRRRVVGPITPPPAVQCSAPGYLPVLPGSSLSWGLLACAITEPHPRLSSAQLGRPPNPASLQNTHRHPGFGGQAWGHLYLRRTGFPRRSALVGLLLVHLRPLADQ